MTEANPPATAYDEQYYRSHCGELPYSREDPQWQAFFQGIADRLILSLKPRRVLDAGCAMGILVEAFWDRGIECLGIDISEYAISRVRHDIAPYCSVASLTGPLDGKFDLIVCLEVLEHLMPSEANLAMANLTAATDVILFSSTATDLNEPTHVNVQPTGVWLKLFAAHGFFPDVDFDASFAAPHAMLLRRRESAPAPEIGPLFVKLLNQRVRTHEQATRIGKLERQLTEAEAKAETAQKESAALAGQLAEAEARAESARRESAALTDIRDRAERAGVDTEKRLAEQARATAELAAQIHELYAFQKQSEAASAHVREEVRHAHRRIGQIYDSRIWRTLVAGGGMIERVLGRRAMPTLAETPRQEPVPEPPAAEGEARSAEDSSPADSVRVQIDSPAREALILSGSILNVSGWALAEQGIERIEVSLNDDAPEAATYGLMRQDIQEAYPSIPESQHAGFAWYRSTAAIGPGVHRVRVRALSRSGRVVAASAVFRVDPRSLYEVWSDLHSPSALDLERMRRESERFAYQPKISIVTPVYRTPQGLLQRCAASVRAQAYGNWDWILVDDNSGDDGVTRALESLAADARIQVQRLESNRGIAGATNAALRACCGDFVAFLDHDDEITPDALYHIARALNAEPDLDLLYSDEDKLGPDGARCDGFFKPDWSPDLLRSMNYVCHFLVCRRSLLEQVGGLRTGFDGSQDYDLILRLVEKTSRIRRIPRVLYHWRMHPGSTAMSTDQKPKASQAGKRALQEHLSRRGIQAAVEEVGICRYRVRYAIEGEPEVAIIMPTAGNQALYAAIQSVTEKTAYRNFRLIVVDNSRQDTVRAWLDSRDFHGGRVHWLDCRGRPFNFSAFCNHGVRQAESPYALFLNDDTTVITPDWIEAMLEHAQRPEVGAVGAQLLFPNDTIQHAGVVTGIVGIAAHVFRGLDGSAPHYFALSQSIRNCSAVTGACMLVRREVFDRVGGFDEANLPTCFQDVDFCLKIVESGHQVVYTPYARLYHFESATKRAIANPEEIQYMERRWARYIRDDPFYNPNLSRRSDAYALEVSE